jgi:hypothetical protein
MAIEDDTERVISNESNVDRMGPICGSSANPESTLDNGEPSCSTCIKVVAAIHRG